MSTIRNIALLSFFYLLCTTGLQAQSKNALWVEYYPDFQVGAWRLTPEVSYRSIDLFTDQAGGHTFYFRPTATYTVNRYLSLAGSLAYYVSWENATANKHEWVIYQNAALKTPSVAGFSFGLNARLEQMFVKTSADPDHTFGLRLRWTPKLTYKLPIDSRWGWSLSGFAETYNYLTASRAGYFRNALDLGAGLTFKPLERLEATFEYRRHRSYRHGEDSQDNRFRLMIRHKIL